MRFFFLLIILCTATIMKAQVIVLDQSLLTNESFDAFVTQNLTGEQTWHFNPLYGAVCSGYSGGQSFQNEDWLISPAMDLSDMTNARLSFQHTRGSGGVLNVGVAEGWYQVFATANFTGDATTTQWTALPEFNQNVPSAWQFISSGQLQIPYALLSATTRIAFRYYSSAQQSATWEIKNVMVTAQPQPGDDSEVFSVTNWNIEWFGCDSFGPEDESLQLANAAAAMLAMGSDVFCLQEISHTAQNPTLTNLINLMGSDQWAAHIVPSVTDDCDLRQAIIYKKNRVQFLSAQLLNNGNAAQGNSWYYNWSGGRFPAVFNLNFLSGNTIVPVSVVNIHAKAEDGQPSSYTRRLGASQALKTLLDGANYNNRNLILIGDFNDYLVGTSSNNCNCTTSPYQNFMDDANQYQALTQFLVDANTDWGEKPIIEHILISDELFANYLLESATQQVNVAQNIGNYYATTSNHLPVTAWFQFGTLSSETPQTTANQEWNVFPNPATTEVYFGNPDADHSDTPVIFDFSGRLMQSKQKTSGALDISNLPKGIYIIRSGDKVAKFAKQ